MPGSDPQISEADQPGKRETSNNRQGSSGAACEQTAVGSRSVSGTGWFITISKEIK
jgi:hypothetical protein